MNNETNIYIIYNYDEVRKGNVDLKSHEIIIPVIPESLSYNHNANFSPQSMLGRLSPVFQYMNNTDKTISFTIGLHEDITKERDIIELVDKLKKLSYPIDKGGVRNFPNSYIAIGEIIAIGIVETDITWAKPYRSGRYITAEISMTITVEREVIPPTLNVVKVINNGVEAHEITYFDKEIMTEDLNNFDNQATHKKFWKKIDGTSEFNADRLIAIPDLTASDLLLFDNSSADVINLKLNTTTRKFNLAINRMEKLYNAFADADPNNIKSLDFTKNLIARGKDQDYIRDLFTQVKDQDNKSLKGMRETTSLLRTAMQQDFKKYLDNYYDNVNKDLTRGEYNKLLESYYSIVNEIIAATEEVYGYGANS